MGVTPSWELRTIGRDLYRVDPVSGDTQLLARGVEATPTSYREWQLAGSPGEYSEWLKIRKSTSSPLNSGQLNALSIKGIPEDFATETALLIRQGGYGVEDFALEDQEWVMEIMKVMEPPSACTEVERILGRC